MGGGKGKERIGENIARFLASICHNSVYSSPVPVLLSLASGNPVKKEKE